MCLNLLCLNLLCLNLLCLNLLCLNLIRLERFKRRINTRFYKMSCQRSPKYLSNWRWRRQRINNISVLSTSKYHCLSRSAHQIAGSIWIAVECSELIQSIKNVNHFGLQILHNFISGIRSDSSTLLCFALISRSACVSWIISLIQYKRRV